VGVNVVLIFPQKGGNHLLTYGFGRIFLCLHGYPEMMEGQLGVDGFCFGYTHLGLAGGKSVVGE
jgi:hypothetical protein